MSNFKEDQQEERNARHKADQAEIFYEWLRRNPQFGYTAAINLIKGYYNGDDWSAADLTDSANILIENGIISPLSSDRVDSDAARAKQEAEEAEAQERIELTDFICKNRQMQPETEKSERNRFLSHKATDITTLRQIKENILAKRELQAKSVEELKAMVRPAPVSKWKPVPHIYQTRSMLLDLANRDVQGFKSLLLRCGDDQINDILRQVEKD